MKQEAKKWYYVLFDEVTGGIYEEGGFYCTRAEAFERIREIVLEILPCHLEVEFWFRYLTWQECEAAGWTWAALEAAEHTWESFQKAVNTEYEGGME